MGFITQATVDAARYIAANIREADKMECDALLALPPSIVLPESVLSGRNVWTFHDNCGTPVGIFGVDPVLGDDVIGTVWMCSTDDLRKHKREFLTKSVVVLDWMHKDYPILTNMVDARNTLHHRWLRWMGFSFLQRIDKWGARGVPFYEFARMKLCA